MKERNERINIPDILGVPRRGIIFSDLDGVWFDQESNFASPSSEQTKIIQKAKNAGYWVVLNSDTGTIPLANFAAELGCNPLVIAENGMVTYLPTIGLEEYYYPIKPLFDSFREAAKDVLGDYENGSIFIEGDATGLIRDDPPLPYLNKDVYLINAMRKCSFGVYTRQTDEKGSMTVDAEKARRTAAVLNDLAKDFTKTWQGGNVVLTCKNYPSIGSTLVRDPRVYKARAVAKILEQFPQDLEYYMIGDSLSDAMDQGRVSTLGIKTCAVGNADERLKAIAKRSGGIVAHPSFTVANGANYIIERILEKGGKP